MKIAGLDIGTTGCKLTVFDKNGAELGKSYRDYPVQRNAEGHEIDAAVLMDAVFDVISDMAAKFPDIAGIGVTSFGETFVMTDERGTPLASAMLYTDPRGRKECDELVTKLGLDNIAGITGVTAHEMYGLPKIMWRKSHDPEIYAKTAHIFQVEDYVVFSLTGRAQIDYSLATRFMTFDINDLAWSDEMLNAGGVDKKLLSEPVPSGTDAGPITSEVAQKTGLRKDTHIISVSQDQVAACVGAGAFEEDIAVDGAGTVQCLTPIFDEMPDVKKMMPGKYTIVPYVVPGKFLTYAFSYTGGALMHWCTSTLAKKEKELGKDASLSVNEYLEREYAEKRKALGLDADGPSGMLTLPHFAGAATPYMDTGSKGAILGLTTDSSVSDIYRSCMEGITYEMYLNYKNVTAVGAKPRMIHATGGGAHSSVWMQMKADMLNLPVTALKTVDAGTVGSAMLTGVAIGVFGNLEDAASKMVEKMKTYEPRAGYHEKYIEVFGRYEKVYDAVRGLMP
ncbi:MAG: carbohydrate kinase [Lachnospiraceae bacterium]|nr:carbohydrate kinase [Lachnospiraceae bacterium]